MTETWHVDDLRVSHVEEAQVKKFGDLLKANFNKNDLKVTHHRKHVHEYLGIGIDYSDKGKFNVYMILYLCSVFYGFSEKSGEPFASPATDHLFQIRDEKEAKFLDEEKAREFHRVVAQLLFLCNCARKDIQTAVAFLIMRVNKPDEDDWEKTKKGA